MALLTGLTACGLKTPPEPKGKEIPSLKELRIWQRGKDAIVAWWMPSGYMAQRFGGVEEFELIIEKYPFDCPSCSYERIMEVVLPLEGGDLHREKSRAYYRFTLPETAAFWRARVIIVYRKGRTFPSKPALFRSTAELPSHTINWEWKTQGSPREKDGENAEMAARLFWPKRRERLVRVLEDSGAMVEKERFFSYNLYRRQQGEEWPFTPLNQYPIHENQWFFQSKDWKTEEASKPLEFTLRLVDFEGNEGPPAPPVTISFPGKRQ